MTRLGAIRHTFELIEMLLRFMPLRCGGRERVEERKENEDVELSLGGHEQALDVPL